MKLENAVRLVLGVAMVFGAYVNDASASSCLAESTVITIINCPPGSTNPNPEWPFPDTTPPDYNNYATYLVPDAPANPYYVTCVSSVEDRVNHARYALTYYMADQDAKNGAHYDTTPNTFWYIRYNDGKYQVFMDNDAYSAGTPVNPGNIEIAPWQPPSQCDVPEDNLLPWPTY